MSTGVSVYACRNRSSPVFTPGSAVPTNRGVAPSSLRGAVTCSQALGIARELPWLHRVIPSPAMGIWEILDHPMDRSVSHQDSQFPVFRELVTLTGYMFWTAPPHPLNAGAAWLSSGCSAIRVPVLSAQCWTHQRFNRTALRRNHSKALEARAGQSPTWRDQARACRGRQNTLADRQEEHGSPTSRSQQRASAVGRPE
jgi:hypothetical protein